MMLAMLTRGGEACRFCTVDLRMVLYVGARPTGRAVHRRGLRRLVPGRRTQRALTSPIGDGLGLQYAENLTDRQAAEAVRCRPDWNYCLGMDLDDPGFDFLVLSEFRARMAQGDRADRLLAVMVDHLVAAGLGRF